METINANRTTMIEPISESCHRSPPVLIPHRLKISVGSARSKEAVFKNFINWFSRLSIMLSIKPLIELSISR